MLKRVRLGGRIDRFWQEHWPLSRGKYLFSRVHDQLYRNHILKAVVVRTNAGFLVEVDGRDMVTRDVLLTGEWEPETGQAIRDNLNPGDVFIDVGAHVGYFSLLANGLVGGAGKVVSIEANPTTAARLRKNIELNGFKHSVVYEGACVDHEKPVTFFTGNWNNTGGSSVVQGNAGKGSTKVTVRGVTLDKIVSELGLKKVDLIKIDAEGAEPQVLLGASGVLESYGPALILELKGYLLGEGLGQVESILTKAGYRHARRIDAYGNELWIKSSHA
jgi:FkbM family methyltransferase